MPEDSNSNILRGYAWIKDMPSQLLVSIVKTYNLLEHVVGLHYEKFGLSEAKFNALYLLYKAENGLPLSELGSQMLVTRANITGLVDRLENEQLVVRHSHPTDRRSIVAKITEQGRKLIDDIIPSHIKLNNQLAVGLSVEERDLAIKLLNKLCQGLITLKNTNFYRGENHE